ncbi:MAG: hypothetical protein K2O78_10510, partial [Muribaculaceae bacterium]|nr:hypothetical protein [Muribaculaceae bacterium]
WIRTTEGINQQIYSLPHLATLVFALVEIGIRSAVGPLGVSTMQSYEKSLDCTKLFPVFFISTL